MLGLDREHRAVLGEEFGHLFDHRFWRSAQEAAATGEPHEILPYPPTARLGSPTRRASAGTVE